MHYNEKQLSFAPKWLQDSFVRDTDPEQTLCDLSFVNRDQLN